MPNWYVGDMKMNYFEDTEQWSIGIAFKLQLPTEQYRRAVFIWFSKNATVEQVGQAFLSAVADLKRLSEIDPTTSA